MVCIYINQCAGVWHGCPLAIRISQGLQCSVPLLINASVCDGRGPWYNLVLYGSGLEKGPDALCFAVHCVLRGNLYTQYWVTQEVIPSHYGIVCFSKCASYRMYFYQHADASTLYLT